MPEADFDEAAWRERLASHRAEKDDFFAEDPQSPIPAADRAAFEKLAYFEPDPDYRVVARLEHLHEPVVEELEMTQGPPAEYTRPATLGFTLEGDHHTLAAYRVEGEQGLFVPFADETNGEETFDRGRYLEVDAADVASGEHVAVDFNLAYAPFCAYNDAYACPIPPAKNELPIAIRAGEQYPPSYQRESD